MLNAHPFPEEYRRSVAYVNQNVFRRVSSSMTVLAGGMIDGALKDLDIEWKGGHIFKPIGTEYLIARPIVRNIYGRG